MTVRYAIFTPTRSLGLSAGQSSPGNRAAQPARGGDQPGLDPTCAVATPVFVEAAALQAEWDRAGAMARLRILARHPATRADFVLLPWLLLAVALSVTLLAAALGGAA